MAEEDTDDADDIQRMTVTPQMAGGRIDAVLAGALDGLSRSRIKALITGGRVAVDGRTVDDPSRRVNAGESVLVDVPEPVSAIPVPEDIPLTILHEDAHLIVIDKPAGLVVHPGAGNWTGTLVNALLHHCGDSLSGIGGVARPGIVHRLDKETSGVLVVAKTDAAHRHLSAQFADHGRAGCLERAYVGIVWGVPAASTGTVDTLIGRDPHHREQMKVLHREAAGARRAITHYAVEEALGGQPPVAASVTCHLETGRTHQIRVHMAHLGHPLLGDPTYGAGFKTKRTRLAPAAAAALDALGRQALHAALLVFQHPATGRALRFVSPPPADFQRLADALRGA